MSKHNQFFAIVTPFTKSGRIDEKALFDYLKFLEESGVRSIIVNGTTGEFASLSMSERIDLLELTRMYFSGYIVNNISSCSYKEANTMARLSVAADALLILPPFYYCSIENAGLINFFVKSLDGLSKPVYIYNFPKHVKTSISPSIFKEIIAVCQNVTGIKDSGGDIKISQGFNDVSDNIGVFVGEDSLALQVLKCGLSGSVTGAGNPFPEFLVALNTAWSKGDIAQAEKIQRGFDIWNNFRKTLLGHEISIVKYTLSLRLGSFLSLVRTPLIELEQSEKIKIKNSLDELLRVANSVKII
jgi:dihydrodipicolinate synthase/N-acetylneuraminate lyase